jgi:hypothetical protein
MTKIALLALAFTLLTLSNSKILNYSLNEYNCGHNIVCKGIYYYANGDKYDGDWKNDKR